MIWNMWIHLTFGMDLKIVFLTAAKVVKRSGTLSGADQVVADFDEYRKKETRNEATGTI